MKTPQILILYKKSTYKHYFQSEGRVSKKVKKTEAIEKRFIDTHLEHYRTLAKVEAFLSERKQKYTKMLRGGQKDFKNFDLIITIGGDGTFLEAARDVKTQFILGVNSDPKWSVGRFCYVNSSNFAGVLENFFRGKAKTCPLNRMEINLLKCKISTIVLNDILICHRNPAAMSRYYLEFGKKKEEQRSSGIWVSTAAGSTGAIRSAGGTVLPEKSRDLQFIVREPYCGKTQKINCRNGIFDKKTSFKVTSLMTDGVVYFDGSHNSLAFGFGEELRVRNSRYPLNLVVG